MHMECSSPPISQVMCQYWQQSMALESPHWQQEDTPALQTTASTQLEETSQLVLQVGTASRRIVIHSIADLNNRLFY